MVVGARLCLLDDLYDQIVVVGDGEELHVLRRDRLVGLEHHRFEELAHRRPEFGAVEDDGDRLELAGLHEREHLEHLVHGAEAAGEEDEGLRAVGEGDLAGEEEVEGNLVGDVGVVVLLHRELDREPDGLAAGLEGAAVAAFHDARSAARDYGVAQFLCDSAAEMAGLLVELVAFLEARRTVEGHGLVVGLHLRDALLELLVDAADAHAVGVFAVDLHAAVLDLFEREVAVADGLYAHRCCVAGLYYFGLSVCLGVCIFVHVDNDTTWWLGAKTREKAHLSVRLPKKLC